MQQSELSELGAALTEIATRHNYPSRLKDNLPLDADWAELLHTRMKLSPNEASRDGIWHFMTCVLAPDLVRWRWPGDSEGGASDRWVTVRHRGRNCFGRLWWRAEILSDTQKGSTYALVHELKEDEFVQIMERPWLAGNRDLSRKAAAALVTFGRQNPSINRALIFREVQKHLLRAGAFIEFQVLNSEQVDALIAEAFEMATKDAEDTASVAR